MATLFEIVGDYKNLYEMMIDETADPAVINDTLDAVMGELEEKGSSYIAVIDKLDMEMAKADELVKRFTAIRDARKNAIKRMKDRLLIAMNELGKTEIEADGRKIKVQNNGGKRKLDIDKELVPDSYRMVVMEIDEEKIRKELEDGKELSFAHLEERGKHVRIV